MNDETSYLLFQIFFITPVVLMLMYWAKWHYISTICRDWNRKLYRYIEHLESEKDLGMLKSDYKYLNDMYLYPETVGIRLFSDWKESDLILDKITLFEVNQYDKHLSKSIVSE